MLKHSRSLRSATDANGRRILAAVAAANGAPTADTPAIPSMGRFEAIDCVARCTGAGGSYDVHVWWWYETAQLWVYDTVLGAQAVTTAGGPVSRPIFNSPNYRTANGIYLELRNFAGGGVADVWLSGAEQM